MQRRKSKVKLTNNLSSLSFLSFFLSYSCWGRKNLFYGISRLFNLIGITKRFVVVSYTSTDYRNWNSTSLRRISSTETWTLINLTLFCLWLHQCFFLRLLKVDSEAKECPNKRKSFIVFVDRKQNFDQKIVFIQLMGCKN